MTVVYLAFYQPGERKKNRTVEHTLARRLLWYGLLQYFNGHVNDSGRPQILFPERALLPLSAQEAFERLTAGSGGTAPSVPVGFPASAADLEPVALPDGKPWLPAFPGLGISLSHCEGLAACAIGPGSLGLDAEPVRPFHSGLLRRVCTAQERAFVERAPDKVGAEQRFIQLWTLKESFLKATGEGLRRPMQDISFRTETLAGMQLHALFSGPFPGSIPGWRFWQAAAGGQGQYLLSLCEQTEVPAQAGR